MTETSIIGAASRPSIGDLLEDILIRKEGHNLIANNWGTGAIIFLSINVVLSAITASSLFKILALPEAVPAIFAILITVNSGLMALFEPSKKVEQHRVAIAKYEQAELLRKRDELQQKMADIRRESPILRFNTRKRAVKRLKELGKLSQDFLA